MSAPAEVEDRNGQPWTPKEIAFAFRKDMRTADIAAALGRSYVAVTSVRNRRKAVTS